MATPASIKEYILSTRVHISNKPYNKTCIILQYVAAKQSMNTAIYSNEIKSRVFVHSKAMENTYD